MGTGRAEPPDVTRAATIAALGIDPTTPAEVDRVTGAALTDAAPRVRAAAISAAVRAGTPEVAAELWAHAITDDAPEVRRRSAELAPTLVRRGAEVEVIVGALVGRLADDDTTVVESAAYALGELGEAAIAGGATEALSRVATRHDDAIAREAAVAAIGALGDPSGLPAVLAACTDKATVRRRAVLALAPFEGPDVDAALATALTDRDWQVRQAAEDLSPSMP